MDIRKLLEEAVKKNASDLHLTVGVPPALRINGELVFTDMEKLTPEESKRLVYSTLSDSQKIRFEEDWELDFSLAIKNLARFRVNVHMEKGNVEAAFRTVSMDIRTLEELGLPPIVAELARRPDGLVLITGPTGVGKTTTLAAMANLISRERHCLIITIEDPIEYLLPHQKSVIKQREVHSDTKSFAGALQHVLRQDPDVIIVGEMRDLETISMALMAAETGHLVLSTLHTPDAPQTVNRIIDIFPPHQQQQIKVTLASSLQGIVSQQLLPRADGQGRAVAVEILIATSGVRNIIRDHKTEQLPTMIQTGISRGMQSMDSALKELYRSGIITYETAVSKIKEPADFKKL